MTKNNLVQFCITKFLTHIIRECVINPDNGSRGWAANPKDSSPGHCPGLIVSALSGRIGCDL